LRRISNRDLVIQTDDKRVVTISTANATKYYKVSGVNGSLKDFGPGDQVNIDTNKDDNDYYHALRVNQVKVATAEERAAASQPVDDSPIASGDDKADSDGPPKLRRAASSDGASSNNDDSARSGSSPDSDGPPRMRRATSSDTDDTQNAQTAQVGSRGTVSPSSLHLQRRPHLPTRLILVRRS
jgi:hypothetical protein